MTLYRDYQPALYPTALQDPYGQTWGRVQGAMKDRVITLAADAVDAGLVLRCTNDALPLLGADVSLEQFPTEDADEYRVRISQAWDVWPWAGTETGLAVVAEQLGVAPPVVFVTGRTWPQGRPDLWARWWILVPVLATPYSPDGTWADAGTWDDGGTWDSDATPEEVERSRRALRQFTNARDVGHLRFAFNTTDYWDDGGVWDGGEIDESLEDTDLWNDDPAFLEWRI
ncbi:MAG: phage tail protein [Deltaproteobacteria bacterium]|nr:phage tail protein [Myxococcales bacterium]MDP3219930.1 phage tail protein [Deltaproteobacteria bacterium]